MLSNKVKRVRKQPMSNRLGKTILSVRTAVEFTDSQSLMHAIRKS